MGIERIVPGTIEWDAFYANHIVRYRFAGKVLNGRIVDNTLDAACGVGYGTAYLGSLSNIKKVTGVDRSKEALAIAKHQFASDNIAFIEDDCHTLAAASTTGPYNLIVSFETLEHLPKPADFLKSCHQQLAEEGTFIVSTPNQTVSSPEELNWEYHEKEYTATELYELLRQAGFINIKLYGQQLNFKGKLKEEFRAELNRIWSNPFIRAGRWIQKILTGHKPVPVLKETEDDFEIIAFETPQQAEALGKDGPFVLIATANK